MGISLGLQKHLCFRMTFSFQVSGIKLEFMLTNEVNSEYFDKHLQLSTNIIYYRCHLRLTAPSRCLTTMATAEHILSVIVVAYLPVYVYHLGMTVSE